VCHGRIEFSKIYKICGCCIGMKKGYGSFVLVVLVGLVMAGVVLIKIFFKLDIDSDWFWFLAGVGLMFEGVISYRRQKKINKKYKVVERGAA
jgi:hypothetical protein